MYERSYGMRYDELGGKYVPPPTSKLMRRDIKAAIASGELPGCTGNYSVRVKNYSGGRSINIEARDLEGMGQDCDGTVPGKAHACPNYWCAANNDSPHAVLTVEGERVEGLLKGIHSAYNHDGSDVMTDYFDVNYYGQACIEDEWSRAFRQRSALAARR